jgi:arylformamidase
MERFSLLLFYSLMLYFYIFMETFFVTKVKRRDFMYKRISYTLTSKAPGWPNNPTLEITPDSLISNGDNCNTFQLNLFNHFGSHMDGPKHFNDQGARLGDLPIETFFYERPLLVDIPKTFGELVTVTELSPFQESIKSADLLMIRSGFSEQRVHNPARYASEGPAMSAEACKYLMDYFPNLKAIALDWISLASYVHPEDGVLAHQYLLGKFHNHYICIIEDLLFEGLDNKTLKKVWSIPLFVEEIDSAPVTVLAEVGE